MYNFNLLPLNFFFQIIICNVGYWFKNQTTVLMVTLLTTPIYPYIDISSFLRMRKHWLLFLTPVTFQEEEYEWGNSLATSLPQLSPVAQVLARAACRWRKARAESHTGPFYGVTALLHVQCARKKLLAKLIEAGDGTAVTHE